MGQKREEGEKASKRFQQSMIELGQDLLLHEYSQLPKSNQRHLSNLIKSSIIKEVFLQLCLIHPFLQLSLLYFCFEQLDFKRVQNHKVCP